MVTIGIQRQINELKEAIHYIRQSITNIRNRVKSEETEENEEGIFYPEDYGAVGDNTHDDTVAIQTAIDNAINFGGGTVFFTAGKVYKTTDSLFILKEVNGAFAYVSVTLKCVSDKFSASYLGVGVNIQLDSLTKPVVVIQGAAGVLIEGIRFLGKNNIAANIFGDVYDSLLIDSNFSVDGLRINPRSPQAGIVVDPFKPAVPVEDRYPDWSDYYHDGANSTQITIRDCGLYRNAVGVSWAPHSQAANGDNSRIEDCHFEENRIGIQVLGNQARNLACIRCSIAISLFCITNLPVDDFNSSLAGAPVRVYGGCFGSSKYLFAICPTVGISTITGLYAESFMSIGFMGTTNSNNWLPCSFFGCEFSPYPGTETQIDSHLYAFAPTLFEGCSFYSEGPISVYNKGVGLGRVTFRNCGFIGRSDQLYMSISSPDYVVLDSVSQLNSTGSDVIWYDGPARVNKLQLGTGITVTAGAGGTATFTATVGVMPSLVVGDYVCVAPNSTTRFFPKTYDANPIFGVENSFAIVQSVDGFNVTVNMLAESFVADGLSDYSLEIVRPIQNIDSPKSSWIEKINVTNTDSPWDVTDAASLVFVDTTLGVVTINLPAVAISDGRQLQIVDWSGTSDTNAITIAAQNGETVNGAASITINTEYAAAYIYCDGTKWRTISSMV